MTNSSFRIFSLTTVGSISSPGMNASTNITLPSGNSTGSGPILSEQVVTAFLSQYYTISYGGALGNLFVACLIFFRERLRTGCGVLIGHALIAHTLLCFFCYPLTSLTIYGVLVNHWKVDIKYCGIAMWMQVTCQFAGNWVDTCIATNRLVALCFPHSYRSFSKERLINITILTLWIFAVLLGSVGYFDFGVEYIMLPFGACGIITKDSIGVLSFALGVYLPLAYCSACYCVVYVRMLASRSRKIGNHKQSGETAKEKNKQNKANMVFVSFCWNTTCYLVLPLTFTAMPEVIMFYPTVPLVLGTIQLLGYFANPVIFFSMGADYRRELQKVVHSLKGNLSLHLRVRPRIHAGHAQPSKTMATAVSNHSAALK